MWWRWTALHGQRASNDKRNRAVENAKGRLEEFRCGWFTSINVPGSFITEFLLPECVTAHTMFKEETRWPGYYYRGDHPKLDDKELALFHFVPI